MGKVPFLFQTEKTEFMKGFAEAIGKNTRISRERYLSPDNVLKFNHGRTWEAPANISVDTAGEMKEHGTETDLNLQDIAAGKVEVVFLAVSQITDELNSQLERSLFETLSGATEKSGQMVDGTKKTFPESMYEMLEMMELPLDEKGELSMPTMFIHPSQVATLEAQIKSSGLEFNDKFSALKVRKKFESQERERKRLSRFERPQT